MVKIGLIIPTLNAGDNFVDLLNSIEMQGCNFHRKLIIDSGSIDKTLEFAKKYKYEILSISQADFNHGGTRKQAIEHFKDIDVALLLTQDVVLYDDNSVINLVKILENKEVGAAYGRQLPYKDASLLSSQARLFNYPDKSEIRSYLDKERIGIKTTFLSDSFAVYRCSSLKEVGGFPTNVIIAEDMYVAAKMLLKNYKIAYVADARVYHSHEYTLLQEFRRYFDTGVFQAREAWIRKNFGNAEGEGLKLVKNQTIYLYREKEYFAIIRAVLANIVKFIGYRLGVFEKFLPICFKKVCSGQSYFFK
jgi:rhamnosyltransferase